MKSRSNPTSVKYCWKIDNQKMLFESWDCIKHWTLLYSSFLQSYCILVPRVTAVRTGQRKHLFWHSSRWYTGYHHRLLCWRNAHPQHGGNHGRGQQSDNFQRQCLLDPRRDGERPPPHLSLLTLLIRNGMVRCAEIPQDWSTSDMGGEFLVSVTLSS